jgi:hypothetical protein
MVDQSSAWIVIPVVLYGAFAAFLQQRNQPYLPSLIPFSSMRFHDRRENFHLCGCVVVTPFFLIFSLMQLMFVCETTPTYCSGITGVCGASSCTQQQLVDEVYNANGVFGFSGIMSSYFNFEHTYCVYDCA